VERFAEIFSELPDPRAENALHDLRELLFIALLATLCGGTSCTDMALFARMKFYLLEPILKRMDCRATTRSAGCSACSIRRPSSDAFGCS